MRRWLIMRRIRSRISGRYFSLVIMGTVSCTLYLQNVNTQTKERIEIHRERARQTHKHTHTRTHTHTHTQTHTHTHTDTHWSGMHAEKPISACMSAPIPMCPQARPPNPPAPYSTHVLPVPKLQRAPPVKQRQLCVMAEAFHRSFLLLLFMLALLELPPQQSGTGRNLFSNLAS